MSGEVVQLCCSTVRKAFGFPIRCSLKFRRCGEAEPRRGKANGNGTIRAYSLSLWERAGVRVRSLSPKPTFDSLIARLRREGKKGERIAGRAVNPHPYPLPEGEGTRLNIDP